MDKFAKVTSSATVKPNFDRDLIYDISPFEVLSNSSWNLFRSYVKKTDN